MQFTTRADDDESVEIYRACWSEHFSVVDEAMALQNALDDRQTEGLERLMTECLSSTGSIVGEWPSGDRIDPVQEARCHDQSIAKVR